MGNSKKEATDRILVLVGGKKGQIGEGQEERSYGLLPNP
jgi:hypothetical protein